MSNLSKEKREKLLNGLEEVKRRLSALPQTEETAQMLLHIAEAEKELRGKRYGLLFEEHGEGIDERLSGHLPVAMEQTELSLGGEGPLNFILEGDNLASLQLLKCTHKGRVDVIYIDPPYNTGNKDFAYDDVFVDANDTFRHSKWLSFMEKRLKIARELLADDGVIFISIDDNEQAQLKLLCDDILHPENFITCFHWEKTQHFGRQKINFYSNCEYVLCYAKKLVGTAIKELLVERVNTELTDAPLYNASNNEKELTFPVGSVKFNVADGVYERTESPDYTLLAPVTVKDGRNATPLILRFRSRWAQNTVEEEHAKGTTFWVKSKNFAIRTVYHEGKASNVAPRSLIFTNNKNPLVAVNRFGEKVGVNENASAELADLVKSDAFSYPKPVSLITYLLSLYYDYRAREHRKDITVLDFFAGSGTTGQAVMKLNALDGGTRRFILCTNNENGICREVMYERLKRAMEREQYACALKYCTVGFVPVKDRFYYEYADELLEHIRALVEMENGVKVGNGVEILLTEEEFDDYISNLGAENPILYLGPEVLPSGEQEAILTARKMQVHEVPNYYYGETVEL